MKFSKSITYIMILAMGSMLTFSSCSSDPDAMELPPAESLMIDWDLFPSAGATKSLDADLLTSTNFGYSALNVASWSVLAALTTVVPTTAYMAILNEATPVYLGDNTWEWKQSVTVGLTTVIARLEGARIDNDTYSMEMYLSVTGQYEDFKWFEGTVHYDRTEANWTLYNGPNLAAGELLEINYSRDFENEVYNTRYTVVDPSNDLYQGYIDFGIDGTAAGFDAHFDISVNDTITNIEWDSDLGSGRVKSEKFFEDTLWHCWDSQLQDVDCNDGM